jgi:diguanylate cyclase (GGDEF)-like protein
VKGYRRSTALPGVFPLPAATSDSRQLSQELWSEIRVRQSIALVRQMPMIIVGNGLSSVIGYFALLSVSVERALIILPILMWLALAPMFLSWARLRNYPIPKTVSVRRIRGIVAYSGALGMLWAVLEVYYLPATPFEVAAFLMAGCGFLSVAAVAALSTLPWACLAYATPMMLTATFIAAGYNHPAHIPVTLLLVLMCAGLFWFLRQNWLNFIALMQTLNSERRLREELAASKHELEQANDRLSSLAATDALTDLPNRRRFDHALLIEWRRARRTAKPLSLLMIDIDQFKHINDLIGHAAGDDCLRVIAQTIKKHMRRAGDLAARFGGDEFAAILPETDESDAFVIADNIRRAVEMIETEHRTTVSIGVTTAHPNATTMPEEALAIADQAVYEAKQGGRNSCVARRASPSDHSRPALSA